jgi:hypothetical protein
LAKYSQNTADECHFSIKKKKNLQEWMSSLLGVYKSGMESPSSISVAKVHLNEAVDIKKKEDEHWRDSKRSVGWFFKLMWGNIVHQCISNL